MLRCCKRRPEPPHTIYHLPSVAPPGSSSLDPHVVSCRLPGGTLCTCAVPNLSASDVRSALASTLHIPVHHLADFSLLWVGVGPSGLQLWDERVPLPAETFFAWGSGRPNFQYWSGHRRPVLSHRPTVELRRLRAPAHGAAVSSARMQDAEPAELANEPEEHAVELSAAPPAAVTWLDSEQLLDDLRRGEYPFDLLEDSDEATLDMGALAILVASGSYDRAVHTQSYLASLLPRLLPSTRGALDGKHAALLSRLDEWTSHLSHRGERPQTASLAARSALLARLRRALPVLAPAGVSGTQGATCGSTRGPVPAPAEEQSRRFVLVAAGDGGGASVDLGGCLLFRTELPASSSRPLSCWGAAPELVTELVLAVGPVGLVLLPLAAASNRRAGESEEALLRRAPAATLLTWRDLSKWTSSPSEIELLVRMPSAKAPCDEHGRTLGRDVGGGLTALRLRTERAALIGCALQTHATPDDAPVMERV